MSVRTYDCFFLPKLLFFKVRSDRVQKDGAHHAEVRARHAGVVVEPQSSNNIECSPLSRGYTEQRHQ